MKVDTAVIMKYAAAILWVPKQIIFTYYDKRIHSVFRKGIPLRQPPPISRLLTFTATSESIHVTPETEQLSSSRSIHASPLA